MSATLPSLVIAALMTEPAKNPAADWEGMMAKKETFGSYTRFSRADVKTFAINDIEGRILPAHEPDYCVVHPRDLRRRLVDIVASDRYWNDLEERFLSRFQSSKASGRVNTASKLFERNYGKKAATKTTKAKKK